MVLKYLGAAGAAALALKLQSGNTGTIELRKLIAVGAAYSVYSLLDLLAMAAKRTPAKEGRVYVEAPEDFVVFHIGVAVKSPWVIFSPTFWKFAFTFFSMGPMVREQFANREIGMLHTESYFPSVPGFLAGKPSMMIQYWKSKEHLINFARSDKNAHLGPWMRFSRLFKEFPHDVLGIYHETFEVKKDAQESIFLNIPDSFGMLGAFGSKPVPKKLNTAKQRLGMKEDDPALAGN